MFQVTIESLLDFLGDQAYGANLIQIERVNHVGLGVEPAVFDQFYSDGDGDVQDDTGCRLDDRDGTNLEPGRCGS